MTPPNWPRISPALFYRDAATAIDWLCATFGFTLRLRVDTPDGDVAHSELEYSDGVIMVASEKRITGRADDHLGKSPLSLDGVNTQTLCVTVNDVDAHCARARDAGANIFADPQTDDHGPEWGAVRIYGVEDLERHRWWFQTRIRAGQPPS